MVGVVFNKDLIDAQLLPGTSVVRAGADMPVVEPNGTGLAAQSADFSAVCGCDVFIADSIFVIIFLYASGATAMRATS